MSTKKAGRKCVRGSSLVFNWLNQWLILSERENAHYTFVSYV